MVIEEFDVEVHKSGLGRWGCLEGYILIFFTDTCIGLRKLHAKFGYDLSKSVEGSDDRLMTNDTQTGI